MSVNESSNTNEDMKVVQIQGSSKNEPARKLMYLCDEFVQKNGFTMGSQRLAAEIVKMLQAKGSNSESIQIKLFELIGEAGFEFMFTIIGEMDNFKFISMKDLDFNIQEGGNMHGTVTGNRTGNLSAHAAAFPSLATSVDMDSLSLNQKKKREKRERELLQKEEEFYTGTGSVRVYHFILYKSLSNIYTLSNNNSIEHLLHDIF